MVTNSLVRCSTSAYSTQPRTFERPQGLEAPGRFYTIFLTLLFLLITAPAATQTNYTAPLKGPLLVTGTFGELRTDHYHAGLDFRAKTGTPVYAVKEGFVSRIVVSGGGFGQAVYVDHPDGRRSVYAHLERFTPALKDTVRARQFAEEYFVQDLRFDSLAYPVQQGEKIGEVGNRGHSFGSHLHFELREIDGDAPINPLLAGFRIPDRRAPQIRSLRVYELDGAGRELAATTYKTHEFPDTLVVRTPTVALGLKAYDRQDGLPNWNGVYTARLFVDSSHLTGFQFDRIPFEQTRSLNALTDHKEWTENTSWFYKFYAGPQVQSDWVNTVDTTGRGRIRLTPNRPVTGLVTVADYAGNESVQAFTLVYRPGEAPQKNFPHQYYLPAGEESLIQRPDLEVFFPKDALYEDAYLPFAVSPDNSAERYSPTYHFGDSFVPLHTAVTLSISPNQPVPDSLVSRVYIGECGPSGKRISSRRTELTAAGAYEARTYSFGDYALLLDTIPPTVRINSFPTNLSRYAGFSVLITDDVSGGGLTYRGTVDGNWVLLEYDAKNDKLTHNFRDSNLGPGRHRFELTLTDGRGNVTVWSRIFTK